MPPSPAAPPPAMPATFGASSLRRRSLTNLFRMGHCAPAVMQTLIGPAWPATRWLVELSAGLPGGIGNSGGECGGLTAPLILLGLRHGLATDDEGVPRVAARGHELLRRFEALHGSASCREIRGDARVPWRCIEVVRESAVLCRRVMDDEGAGSMTIAQRRACARLHAHWVARDFHCARTVFRLLGNAVATPGQVPAAASAFMGGTVFAGRTCGALVAGVMALGLSRGEIEHSPLRVARMLAKMAVGGDAFADGVNAFNRSMNLGHALARWFAGEYGSTQCRVVTGCDFSTAEGVARYLEDDVCARCEGIARGVAGRVAAMVDSAGARP